MKSLVKIIKQMTVEEKTGQLIIGGFDGTVSSATVRSMILEVGVGGVILFTRNITSPSQLGRLSAELQELAKQTSSALPLFISVDNEGGRVTRCKEPFTLFPPAASIGKHNSIDLAKNYSSAMAKELFAVGINMNFTPVLDVLTNNDNSVIGDRSFSSDPNVVSALGNAFIEGMRTNQIIPVGKHFPGHGSTSKDSHFELPLCTQTYEHLMATDIKPFSAAIQNGLEAIMTAHVLYTTIDPDNCATTSSTILQGILREKLSYQGLIISDDMEMKAIANQDNLGDACVKAVDAGVDVLLICHSWEKIESCHKTVVEAVKKGILAEKRVDQSVERIIALKERYNLFVIKQLNQENK